MRPIGVYVHFPWCLQKCPYCDFTTYPIARDAIDHRRYADAVIAELDRRLADLPPYALGSVFFGGGTPSLWDPPELGRVLARVVAAFGATRSELEITVECNPSSLDEERARALVDVGVDRISIGTQALDDARLRFLGRLHNAQGALAAIRGALRAAVPRVSADLIFAVGDQTAAQAASDATQIADLGLRHLSVYGLTIEPGTRFGDLARRGKLPLAVDDVMVESFFAVEATLARFGLAHYEVSNYAAPGHESRHNLGYWRGDDYLGLGCAAYGTVHAAAGSDGAMVGGTASAAAGGARAVRYRNPANPESYVAAALGGLLGIDSAAESAGVEIEPLDAEACLRERIMLGLRLAEGVDIGRAATAVGAQAWPEARRAAAERLVARGRLFRDGDCLAIPREARIWIDDTARELF